MRKNIENYFNINFNFPIFIFRADQIDEEINPNV